MKFLKSLLLVFIVTCKLTCFSFPLDKALEDTTTLTPHIEALKEDMADVVIMPGDPFRAKWMANTFLQDVKVINTVRGMLGFTGYYKGKKVSIMGHGMGIPSIGIYSHELMHPDFYDVKCVIRVGSAGAYSSKRNIGDIIVVNEAYSESTYARYIGVKAKKGIISAPKNMVNLAKHVASIHNIPLLEERVHSTDVFYEDVAFDKLIKRTKSNVVEMEAFALFANAIKNKKDVLCLLTISNVLPSGEGLTAIMRQISFKQMALLSLEIAVEYS